MKCTICGYPLNGDASRDNPIITRKSLLNYLCTNIESKHLY